MWSDTLLLLCPHPITLTLTSDIFSHFLYSIQRGWSPFCSLAWNHLSFISSCCLEALLPDTFIVPSGASFRSNVFRETFSGHLKVVATRLLLMSLLLYFISTLSIYHYGIHIYFAYVPDCVPPIIKLHENRFLSVLISDVNSKKHVVGVPFLFFN